MNTNKISVAVWLACIASGAQAQMSDLLEEVTVTAQKREQSLQDVPIAVSAFTGADMRSLGIETSIDLADFTPGLAISPVFGSGNMPNIAIRGVGLNDFRDYHESPSAVYVDEVYKAALSSLDFQLFDISRAEVLKGPQGTLFGRNATGGLIQYVTNKPSDQTEGYVRADIGSRSQKKFEAAVGGALGESFSGRIAGIYHANDGIQNNVNPAGTDANQTDMLALRAHLEWTPSDLTTVLFTVENGENDNKGGNPYRFAPSFLTDGLSYIDEPNRDVVVGTSDRNDINVSGGLRLQTDYSSVTARLDHEFEGFSLVAIANRQDFEKEHRLQDCDSSPDDFCFTRYLSDTSQSNFEVRLQGDRERITWDIGANYMSLETDGEQTLLGPIAPLFFGPGIDEGITAFATTTSAWAVFGQLEFQLTDTVSLIGGLRYTDDEKDMTQSFIAGLIPYPKATQSDDNVSYLAKLQWRPSDDVMVYGGISQAHKSGTFNSGFGPPPPEDYEVLPEELTSYEIGFKSTPGGGRTQLNGALFYYDYRDHQAFVYRDLTQLLFNADAEVTGAELELVARPTDALDLILGIGYLDTEVADVEDAIGNVADREMVTAPEMSVNATVRYSWQLSGGSSILAQGDASYSSKVFFDNINNPALTEPGRTLVNARIGWVSADGAWETSAWVENLTDEDYRIYAFDLTGDLGYVQEIYHAPRWYGVSVGYNF